LIPPKGHIGIGPADVVDEHHPGIDSTGDAFAGPQVDGEDRAAEAEVAVIRQGDGRSFILDPEHHRHRAEELIAEGGVA
jgi:hypothetical protein